MDVFTEEWMPIYENVIPKQKYTARVSNGEQHGLVILLTGKAYSARIDFGAVQAVQMVDEGTNLLNPPGCIPGESVALTRDRKFANTIYEVHNSAFSRYIQACMGDELYHALKLREFDVVTENYVISVVTRWEPEITVSTVERPCDSR